MARIEVTADEGRGETRVDGGGVEGGLTALGVTGDAERQGAAVAGAEPIGGGEGGLNVVADDVAAEVKGLAVNPLPVRLVGFAERGIVGRQFRATDCNRQEKFETIFREAAGGLRVRSKARGEAEVVFGRLVGIGDENGLRDGRSRWLHVQAGAPHAVDYGPAHLPYAVARGLGDESGLGVVAVTFEGGGQARVDDAEDGLKRARLGSTERA